MSGIFTGCSNFTENAIFQTKVSNPVNLHHESIISEHWLVFMSKTLLSKGKARFLRTLPGIAAAFILHQKCFFTKEHGRVGTP